ncbi:MAG: MFS transporter, partial [Proteobacteria bacterium]|nr:MFS transporter [Pseudomonadota bacterium]
GMTCFAQSVAVYTEMGGSVMDLTLLAVLAQIPGVLITPVAGVLVDRWDRRWVMIIGNTVAALATLSLRMLLVSTSIEIWHLYIFVVIISLANHFQWPAYFSTVPLMVSKDKISSANGLVQMSRSVGILAAPIIAGIAFTNFKLKGVVLFDMSTYLFALTILLFVKIPKVSTNPMKMAKKFSFIEEILYGWKYLTDRRPLLSLLIFFVFANFINAGLRILIIPLGLSFGSPKALGGILSVCALCMILGGITMGIWGGPKRKVYGILSILFMQSLVLIFMIGRPNLTLIIIGLVLITFTDPILNACGGTLWHEKVSLGVQGRVLSIYTMLCAAATQLGSIFAAIMSDYFFIPLFSEDGFLTNHLGHIMGSGNSSAFCFLIIILGTFSLILATIGFLYKPLRFLDSRIPDEEHAKGNLKPIKLEPVIATGACQVRQP